MIDSGVLVGTAAGLAVLHTAVGVDHTIPFVVLSRARGWSLRRTLAITGLCGLGHVGTSVVLGGLGVALGVGVTRLTGFESFRGSLAAWLLIVFGLAYASWAVVRGTRRRHHAHVHAHADGTVHSHGHDHHGEHLHPHVGEHRGLTPWFLFVVFALGPCEALIPLMMAPSMTGHWTTLAAVVLVFGGVTVATMLAIVAAGCAGLRLGFKSARLALRHVDAVTGLVIAASGAAVMLFGI